jgi:hypothetical protein
MLMLLGGMGFTTTTWAELRTALGHLPRAPSGSSHRRCTQLIILTSAEVTVARRDMNWVQAMGCGPMRPLGRCARGHQVRLPESSARVRGGSPMQPPCGPSEAMSADNVLTWNAKAGSVVTHEPGSDLQLLS